ASDGFPARRRWFCFRRALSRPRFLIGRCKARSILRTVQTSPSISSIQQDYAARRRALMPWLQLHHCPACRRLQVRNNESGELAVRLFSTLCDRKARIESTTFFIASRTTPEESFLKETTT